MLEHLRALVKHRYFDTLSTVFLIMLYLLFLLNQVTAIKAGSISPTAIIFVVMETVVIFLLIIRKKPVLQTADITAWAVALGGTFLPLLLAPTGNTMNTSAGNTLMIIGGLMAIASYLSLNASFGLSPALRQIKTSGLYKFVRHPMYLSYYIIYLGYLNLALSTYNATIFVSMVLLLTARIYFEEKLLRQDSSYQAYTEKVRYRIMPYLF